MKSESKSIEFIDLKKQYSLLKDNIDERMKKVLERGDYILGKEVKELEEKFQNYIGVLHCISCANGTDALLMALMAKGIGPGDIIFTTPFTFIATAEVIALLGATPVFVDIDPLTYNIDPSALANTIQKIKNGYKITDKFCPSNKPKGIITVDLYGLPADYDKINKIAAENGLFVIEDAAQSFGSVYKGKKACSLAEIATTSFFPAKPLGCYGDGGAIFTNDKFVAEILGSIRVHGKGTDKYDNIRIGLNGRLDTLQAAVLLAKMDIFDKELQLRDVVAKRYTEGLKCSFVTPFVMSDCTSAWAQYTLRSESRDEIMQSLKNNGIPSFVYYPKPLHLQGAFAYLGYEKGCFPHAEKASQEVFSLPMHPYLETDTQDRIIDIILQSVKERVSA